MTFGGGERPASPNETAAPEKTVMTSIDVQGAAATLVTQRTAASCAACWARSCCCSES